MVEQTRTDAVRMIAQEYAAARGPLLPVLHAVHDRFGSLEPADLETIADVLNLSTADVLGVVSFYDDFRTTPAPAHVVRVCRGEACQAVGAEAFFAAVTEGLAALPDVEVRDVFCLGNCASGPSGTVDGCLHGRLTPERVAGLVGSVLGVERADRSIGPLAGLDGGASS